MVCAVEELYDASYLSLSCTEITSVFAREKINTDFSVPFYSISSARLMLLLGSDTDRLQKIVWQ
jgi:hypothetical protein